MKAKKKSPFEPYYKKKIQLIKSNITTHIYCDASQRFGVTTIAIFDALRHKEISKHIEEESINAAEMRAISFALDYVMARQIRNAVIHSEMKQFIEITAWVCALPSMEELPKQYLSMYEKHRSLFKKVKNAYLMNQTLFEYIPSKENPSHSSAFTATLEKNNLLYRFTNWLYFRFP